MTKLLDFSFPAPLKAVLFDMDGVLFDSMKNHTLAWQQAMEAEGIPTERDEFYLYEGCTGAGTIHRLFRRTFGRDATDTEIERIYRKKSRRFNEMPEVCPVPGIREVLKPVVDRKLTTVLVTGSGQGSLLARLEDEFPGVFSPEKRVTAADVKHGKPHPEPYLKGLDKAGVAAAEALVVENAPMGVKAAKAAGIFTVAVTTGPIPVSLLYEAGADAVFPDMLSFARSLGEWLSSPDEEERNRACQDTTSPTTSE